jgi:hypothetical protein
MKTTITEKLVDSAPPVSVTKRRDHRGKGFQSPAIDLTLRQLACIEEAHQRSW